MRIWRSLCGMMHWQMDEPKDVPRRRTISLAQRRPLVAMTLPRERFPLRHDLANLQNE